HADGHLPEKSGVQLGKGLLWTRRTLEEAQQLPVISANTLHVDGMVGGRRGGDGLLKETTHLGKFSSRSRPTTIERLVGGGRAEGQDGAETASSGFHARARGLA